jgi:hypothetical protein
MRSEHRDGCRDGRPPTYAGLIPEAASIATRDTSETVHSRRGRAASRHTSSVHSSLHFGLDGALQKRWRAVSQDLGPQKVLGWESWKTLVSVWAYHSFIGEVEASKPPR